jgi:hypothetical protein
MTTLFALSNLWMARHSLLALVGKERPQARIVGPLLGGWVELVFHTFRTRKATDIEASDQV